MNKKNFIAVKVKNLYKSYKVKMENRRTDREVYEAISFMRNIISIENGKNISADFIIEQLSKKKGVLRETYIKMLSLLRVNRKKEAIDLLKSRMNSSASKEFAALLIRWDDINPKELTEVLISYQKSIKEIELTNQKRRDENISDMLYFPVIVNVMLLFINFIYVAYFIEQKEMLENLF